MRIVIDATAAVSGGRVYLNQLLPRLAIQARQSEFIVFHAGDLDDLVMPPEAANFEFRRVTLAGKGKSWVGSGILKLLWRLFVLPVHLNRLKPDLLFSNAGFGPGRRVSRVKTVLALHNSMPLRNCLIADERSGLRRLRLVLLRRLMLRALKQSDAAIVFSHDTKDRLIELSGRLQREPEVIYHGIDWGETERKTPVDPDALLRLGLTRPYLLFVSQFHRYKNVVRLLQAFAGIAQKHPQLSLVLAGEAADQSYWREVEVEIARLDLGSRVKHLDACPRRQLIDIYKGALTFIHPSLAETCSFPLLEALALGLPIAAARASALPEMAEDAAIFFDPENTRDLASALELLVTQEDLRYSLSAKAIKRAEMFSWDQSARQTLRLFELILANGDQP